MTTDRQGAHRQAFPVVPGASRADRAEGARKQRSGDGTAEQLSSAPLRCICGFGHEAKATGVEGAAKDVAPSGWFGRAAPVLSLSP